MWISTQLKHAKAISRRELLAKALIASGALYIGLEFCGCQDGIRSSEEVFRQASLLGTVPFADRVGSPTSTTLGEELDGRRFTDLSALTPDSPITPVENFYIRTRSSQLLPESNGWSVRLHIPGALDRVDFATLAREVDVQGRYLLECAGNVRSASFGMLSAADWAGISLSKFLRLDETEYKNHRLLVSGFDLYASESATSIPGASWIFSIDDILAARAFLAVQMNGKLLTKDHGGPVRLIVPGWYGCACIKWVNEIALVADSSGATSQMREYASRTHQNGTPLLARDYEPATIDPAAMPVRIEKWRTKSGILYRIVGILWGGPSEVKDLEIQFKPGERYQSVGLIHRPAVSSWGFWSLAWDPREVGYYSIRLRVADAGVRTRRLDKGYYTRMVEITDI